MNDIAQPSLQSLSGKDKVLLTLLHLLSRLPLSFLQGMGSVLGRLMARRTSGKTYSVVLRNLELCFPDETEAWHQETARENLIHTGKLWLEFSKTWGMPPEYSIAQITQVHNEYLFHEALAAGNGTLAIAPHFGNWELMNAWLCLHSAPTIMYKPVKDKCINQFVLEARGRLHTTLVPTDDRGVKALFKCLKKNGFTAVLPDHVPTDNGGIYAPFFGISTLTGVIAPKLLNRTGCNAVMISCARRHAAAGFEITFTLPDPEIYNTDLAISTAAMNRSIENMIRSNPAQYQWTYKRFKQNETLKDPYLRNKS